MTARFRSPAVGVLVLAVVAGGALAADGKVQLRFSRLPDKATAKANIQIRPNVEQPIYVFVHNDDNKDFNVTVEVRAGGKVVEGGSVELNVKKGETAPVPFGQAPVKKDEKPADKPAEKPKPPTLAELAGPLEFVLLDRDKKDAPPLDVKSELSIRRAASYLGAKLEFKAAGADGKPRLEVTVTANDDLSPPCRVELVLRPDRTPSLDPKQPRKGTYAGYLAKKGAVLNLEAEDLKFKGSETHVNLIYLTVDGYERAFAYRAFFTPEGELAETLQEIKVPAMRLMAPAAADPSKKIPVGIEVDNAEDDDVAELALGRVRDEKFKAENEELVRHFSGNREQVLLLSPKGPGGALLLKAQLRDWSAELDAKDIFGPRDLRLALLRADKEVNIYDTSIEGKGKEVPTVKEILRPLLLDGTPPVLGDLLTRKEMYKGQPLELGVTCSDPESEIKQVVFYLGLPDKDGNPPPNARKEIVESPDKDGVWVAKLLAPTDAKGKVDVTITAWNKADLATVKSVTIELVDKPPPGAGTGAKPVISGKVLEGKRPQPKVTVVLRDSTTDALKDTTVTNDKGEYIFKDVPPGSYVVRAFHTGDATRGRAAVTVVDKDKTGVDITLTR